MTRALLRALAFALAASTASACSGAKREAASLVAAVDRYRRAEMSAKRPLAEALEAVPCSDADVCAAKGACVAAALPTVRGDALKSAVQQTLNDLHAGKITEAEAASQHLPAKLDEASRLLSDGRARLTDCDLKITALRLRYGL
jgi:hypothetical protein